MYELREELFICFTSEESELGDMHSDETCFNETAFLAYMSQAVDTLKKRKQEKGDNILTFSDKVVSFREKLMLWGTRIYIKRTKLKCLNRKKNIADWRKLLLI